MPLLDGFVHCSKGKIRKHSKDNTEKSLQLLLCAVPVNIARDSSSDNISEAFQGGGGGTVCCHFLGHAMYLGLPVACQ